MSDPAPPETNPVPIRFVLGTAVTLLLTLLVIGYFTDIGRPEVLVFKGPLGLSTLPTGEPSEDDEPPPVTLSPPFEVVGPTTLRVELIREAQPGWVGASCGLLEETTGELREFELHTDHRPPDHPSLEAHALIDQVQTGRYTLRFDPSWQPVTSPLPGRAAEASPGAPAATVRAVEGTRSPWGFTLATLLILAPAIFEIGRYYRHKRRIRSAGTRQHGLIESNSSDEGSTGEHRLDPAR